LEGSVKGISADSGGVTCSRHVDDNLDGWVGSLEDVSETDGEDVRAENKGIGSDVGYVIDK
jgi:hypothetical protein